MWNIQELYLGIDMQQDEGMAGDRRTAEFCKQEICLRRGLAKDARGLSINHSELKAQATETQATNIEKSSYCILMVCTPK